MITNIMQIQSLTIGKRGETGAEVLTFDLSEFITRWGAGTATLLHKRPNDLRPYLVSGVVQSNTANTLAWTVSSADTAQAGTGELEIRWTISNGVAKSAKFKTIIVDALVDETTEHPGAVVYMADGSQIDANKNAIAEISEVGKNLYNGENVVKDTTTSVNTEVTLQNQLQAGTYTISAVVKSTSTAHEVVKCNLRIRGDSGELAATTIDVGHPSRSSATFTITETAKSIRFYGSTGTSSEYTVDTAEYKNIQIEKGNVATSYKKYRLTAVDEIARGENYAKTYYVSTSGNDENSGTAASPFATIGKAVDSGASVVVMAKGTYTENYRTTAVSNLKIIGNGSTIKYSNSQNACLEFRNANVEIVGLTFDASEIADDEASISCLFLRDCTAKVTDCKANGSPYMGFRLDGSKVTMERCEATGCKIDGFNAHDTANNVSDGTFIDCVSHDNLDDGLSYHENGSIHVHGGKYYDNTSTGIAPHNGCNCEIVGAYIYGNGSGIEAFNTNSTVSPYPTLVCSGCVITGNESAETARGYGISAKYYNGVVNACAIADNQKGTVVQDANSNIVVY